MAILARNNIAWIRSTHADAKYRSAEIAVKLAEFNAQATAHRDPAKLDTLAARDRLIQGMKQNQIKQGEEAVRAWRPKR